MRAVRPGGRIVLKSRPAGPVPIDVALAVRKEITLEAVAYAPFQEALELLAQRRIDLSDLLGPVRPLEAFLAMAASEAPDEEVKVFLSPEA